MAHVVDAAAAFAGRSEVRTQVEGEWLIVESNGLPRHPTMAGIRNWQQQMPLPQDYRGANAWRIPLRPRIAARPISARRALYRGAISLAVNGVPIFNALNNRGEDAYRLGELDDWGGHCGRADDYHYHRAPIHLAADPTAPIGCALDGFLIYGLTEPDGSAVRELDDLNGHDDGDGRYHYHATETYPYVNGGLRGEVAVRGDQVWPQPRTIPARPAGKPLRGARVVGCSLTDGAGTLDYTVAGEPAAVEYRIVGDAVEFVHVSPSGARRAARYPWPPRRRGR